MKPPLRLLIDIGSMKSILNPAVAEKYFPNNIYNLRIKIITFLAEN